MNARKQHLTEQLALAQSMTTGHVTSFGECVNIYEDYFSFVITASFGEGPSYVFCSAHGKTVEETVAKLHAERDRRSAETKAIEPITEEALHDQPTF